MKHFFSRHSERIRRWLTHPYIPIVSAAVGIVLALSALGTGLFADDYIHRAMLLKQWLWPAEDASLFGLFSFLDGTSEQIQALKEAGFAPWWMFEELQMRVVFWRPLTELTHWLDYQLWADKPWLMHAQSLLWFGAAIWVIVTLYRKIIGPVWVAGLAGVFFAVNGLHGAIAGWICHRNTLIAAFFGSLALLAHVRWRQEAWRPGAVWGPLCYLLGLLSKESALAIGAYLFAYTLILDRGTVRRRVTGFLPYVVITFGWYLTYRHLGFGARKTIPFYIDPGSAPLEFVKALVVRIPLLLVGQFTGIPTDLWNAASSLFSQWNVVLWCVVVTILVLIGFILSPLFRHDAVVRFWAVGLLLGLLPMCAVFPSSRLLFLSGIGAMGIIARFLATWVEQPVWLPVRRFWKRSARGLCFLFVITHLILAPLTLQLLHIGLGILNRSIHRFVSTMPYDEEISQKTVVFVNPPIEPVVGAFISLVRAAYGYPIPARTWSLASGLLPLTITRIDEHTIDIEGKQGLLFLINNKFLRGQSHPMYVGQQTALSGMSVEVLALFDNWQPSTARFTFTVPLDDPSLLWLRWEKEKGFVPYSLPAVGESDLLASPHIPFLNVSERKIEL